MGWCDVELLQNTLIGVFTKYSVLRRWYLGEESNAYVLYTVQFHHLKPASFRVCNVDDIAVALLIEDEGAMAVITHQVRTPGAVW